MSDQYISIMHELNELLKKWRAEEDITEQRIQKGMATHHELLWMQSYRNQLEDTIKKASGSATNTSEAMGNL